jgi:hypothetical protein
MLGVIAVLTENVTLFAVSIFAATEVTAAAWGAMVEVSAQERSACGCRGSQPCRGRSSIPVRSARREAGRLPQGDQTPWYPAEARRVLFFARACPTDGARRG